MTYSFEQFKNDFQQFSADSKDFLQSQIDRGIQQLQSSSDTSAEFRQSVQREITENQLDWLTTKSNEYAQRAAESGDVAKQNTWQTLSRAYSNFADEVRGTAGALDSMANFDRALGNFMTRELGAVPGALMDVSQVYDAYIQGDNNKLGEVATGTLFGILGGVAATVIASGTAGVLIPALFIGMGAFVASEMGKYLWSKLFGVDGLMPDFFTSAQRVLPRRDPLTLDLDGDGLETLGIDPTNPILFDHDGDGVKNPTGWVKADDGFLVLDRNGNGTIDNGHELFGDSTPLSSGANAADGFAALAQEDTNADGKVSSLDARFNQLRIWRDLNQDGISQGNELTTLGANNIASINVAATEHSQTLPNGNQIADLGTYTKTDGTLATVGETSELGDVNLAEDTFHRAFPDQIPITPAIEPLPNMQGAGALRDLREAASLNTSAGTRLATLLTTYAAATTRDAQLGQLSELLDAWADTAGMAETLDDRDPANYTIRYESLGAGRTDGTLPGGDGALGANYHTRDVDLPGLTPEYKALIRAWSEKFHILEAFNGRYFFTFPEQTQPGASALTGISATLADNAGQGGGTGLPSHFLHIGYQQAQLELINQSYLALQNSVYDALFLQTRGKPLLDAIALASDATGALRTDARSGFYEVAEVAAAAGRDLMSAGWNLSAFMSQAISSIEDTAFGQTLLQHPDSLGFRPDLFMIDGDNDITQYKEHQIGELKRAA